MQNVKCIFSGLVHSRSGKLLIAIWIIIIVNLLFVPLFTYLFNENELLGNMIFSLLIISIFINLANIIIYIFKIKLIFYYMNLILWLTTNVLILIIITFTYYIYGEGTIVFIYLMLIIDFPISFIVSFVFSHMEILNMNFAFQIFTPWIVFTLTGYFQWYIIIPRLFNYELRVRR